MTDIVTERSGSILRVQFNRPSKKNAMTSAMYLTMADLLDAADTAQELAEKPAAALQACKRLMKQPWRQQLFEAAKAENKEFSARVRSADTKEAITAFFEKRPPDFTKTAKVAVAQR